MWPIIKRAAVGSFASPPLNCRPFCTVSRFVPRRSICARRSLWLDCVIPSTPTIAATPMLIPSAESAARSRRMRSPRLASASRSPAARREVSCTRGLPGVAVDATVHQFDASIHGAGHHRAVGDNNDGRAIAMEISQELDDRDAGGTVEIAGRLIREDDLGPADDRASDGGPLALATRKLRRSMHQPMTEADPLQGNSGTAPAFPDVDAPVEETGSDVVEHAHPIEEEELLEDKAETGGTKAGELTVAHAAGVDAVDAHGARGGPIERARDVQQGRLPGSGWSHDGEQLTRLDAQRHFPKRFDRWIAGVAAHDVAQLDDGLAHERGTSTDVPS